MSQYDDPLYIHNGVHDDPMCEALIRAVKKQNRSWYHIGVETGFDDTPFHRMVAGTGVLSSRVLSSACYAIGWDNFIEELKQVVMERPNLPPSLSTKPVRHAMGRKKVAKKQE